MEVLLVVSAFAIVPGAIVAAFLGWQGLLAQPPDAKRLTIAVSSVFAPWLGARGRRRCRIGLVSVMTLSIPERRALEWRELVTRFELPWVAPVFVTLAATAVTPAIIATVIDLSGRRSEITDDLRDWLRRWGV